jgi:hypothetical protein
MIECGDGFENTFRFLSEDGKPARSASFEVAHLA